MNGPNYLAARADIEVSNEGPDASDAASGEARLQRVAERHDRNGHRYGAVPRSLSRPSVNRWAAARGACASSTSHSSAGSGAARF